MARLSLFDFHSGEHWKCMRPQLLHGVSKSGRFQVRTLHVSTNHRVQGQVLTSKVCVRSSLLNSRGALIDFCIVDQAAGIMTGGLLEGSTVYVYGKLKSLLEQ